MNLRKRGLAFAAAIGLALLLPTLFAQPAAPDAEIRSLAMQAASVAPLPGPYDGRGWLERFYAPRAYLPAWTIAQARQALDLLRDAPAHGLEPGHYLTDGLLRQVAAGPPHPAGFDVAMTQAMLRYLADLRFGRVRSEFHTAQPDERLQQFDPVEQLRQALAAGEVGAAVRAAEPRFPMYGPVKAALAQYRELASQPQRRLAPPATRRLAPGSPYAGAASLHARLVLLGDLPVGAAPPGKVYNEELAEAVRRFQSRHGLTDDGVLGPATMDALRVPLARRVRQLELTLERLRWLPDLPPGRLLAVNLPAYRLWAYDSAAPATAALEMGVIVGDAARTPTPLFVGQMRYLEFNPYWNVPRSITEKEIVPKLESNPGYLAQNDMELVPIGSGKITHTVDASTLNALRAGKYRVRQRPGPRNALGAVKFMLPNPMDIYLHSTPERELFRRTRRDLSHGCIRVEQPVQLAQFVLGDQPEWTEVSIEAAMAPGPTLRVDLPAEVPVVLFYATAITDREGRALFLRDIYRRDALLERALAEHAEGPNPQIVPASLPRRE